MSKIVFIKDNNQEIRRKLKNAGFSVCICAKFYDSVWLIYHPDENFPYDIHGEGYADSGDYDEKHTPEERIQMRLKEDGYYSKEREFYNTVEEFLEKYGNEKY